ncbi:MAG: hypothetical protein A2Y79_02575 [Deltaproteobacteria bacterium RBG_13_43_22]|nr:MAG: hypothetical protein A2Y79_02575 [Deltaproteobacteria bacterium RBG_13_43_22]
MQGGLETHLCEERATREVILTPFIPADLCKFVTISQGSEVKRESLKHSLPYDHPRENNRLKKSTFFMDIFPNLWLI